MKNLVLEVINLRKQFGKFTAVNDISFSIHDGEILGVLGPNGAGKTTTIQMLLGVMEPTKGEINYFEKPFNKNREYVLKRINFSSSYISLPWWFTVNEVLDVFSLLYEIPDRKKRISKLLKEFQIDHLQKKQFQMLSAGERTRLLLTKAFLNYPKLILLDEPTASLDPDIAVKIREFLKKERKEYNVSMLFTSHNMDEVEEMCDRVVVINHGKVIAENTPINLIKNISDCEVELYIKQNENDAARFFKKMNFTYKQDGFIFKISISEKKISEFLISLASEKIIFDDI